MNRISATPPLVLLLLGACQTPTGTELEDTSSTATDALDVAALSSRAVALIESGSLEEARDVLDELLVGHYLSSARERLANGSPEDALTALDDALAIDPRNTDARLLKADGSLQLAEKAIAEGAGGTLIEGSLQDALEYYERTAGDEPRATLGASRAAYLLSDLETAVDWARRARTALEENQLAGEIEPAPYRTISETLFAAYTQAKGDEARAEEAGLLLQETESALGTLMGEAPQDAWVWGKLSDLFEWEGRYGDARARLQTALERMPENNALLQRLGRVARSEGGGAKAVEVLESYSTEHPEGTLGQWYLGEARLLDALERMRAGEYDVAALEEAEKNFQRCRELFPQNERVCKEREVICRNAIGWCHFNQDELPEAAAAFLSMNDLVENGIRWEWQNEGLRNGILGLAFVGDRYSQLGELEQAGIHFEHAFHADPSSVDWANNTGFFMRDAGYALEFDARRLCKAANGAYKTEETLDEMRALGEIDPALAGTAAESEAFRRAADERFEHARGLMERSWAAYRVAAELLPDNVRVVNDAGLVQTYYLHTEPAAAQALLESAIELGDEQVPALRERVANASEEERPDLESELLSLEEAWSDAYQNLGVHHWLHNGDNESALVALRKSIEIGPESINPRRSLQNLLVPWILGELDPPADNEFDLANWGRPCQ